MTVNDITKWFRLRHKPIEDLIHMAETGDMKAYGALLEKASDASVKTETRVIAGFACISICQKRYERLEAAPTWTGDTLLSFIAPLSPYPPEVRKEAGIALAGMLKDEENLRRAVSRSGPDANDAICVKLMDIYIRKRDTEALMRMYRSRNVSERIKKKAMLARDCIEITMDTLRFVPGRDPKVMTVGEARERKAELDRARNRNRFRL